MSKKRKGGAIGGALKKANTSRSNYHERPEKTQLYLTAGLPDILRTLAKSKGTSFSGLASFLLVRGLDDLLNGNLSTDHETYLTPSNNFAFKYDWDEEKLKAELATIAERVNDGS